MYRHIFRVLCASVPPALLMSPYVNKSSHCFFWNRLKEKDLDNRIHIGLEVSNWPCEDRSAKLQLKSVKGYAFAVFDGHGGWQLSQLCSKVLLETLDKQIQKNKPVCADGDQLIQKSVKEAFEITENMFLQQARQGYKLGFGKFARVGSCALVCIVANNKIYTANAGDSLGLVIQRDKDQRMSYIELNRELNANKDSERERLRQLFPYEDDIVICKRENTACYVKGRLQPTRSIGDLRLKHPEFNNPQNLGNEYEFQSQLKKFSGPYITSQPEITIVPLLPNQKAIVLASDGLWDELQRQQVAELFKSNPINKMPNVLINRALEKAALNAKTTVQKLKQIPVGKKRNLHDDITVVVVDLDSEYKA